MIFNKKISRRNNEEFERLVEELITTFNKVAYENINILEEKIRELKHLLNHADKKIAILKEEAPRRLSSKYQIISILAELGYDIEDIIKLLNLSQQERNLFLSLQKKDDEGAK